MSASDRVAEREEKKKRREEYERLYGSGSPYWQAKAREYQIREAIKKRGLKAVEAELEQEAFEKGKFEAVAQYKEVARAQYREWKAGVREQYPSPKYDVVFPSHGEAEIKERPLYGPPRPPPQPLVETFGWKEEHQTVKQFEQRYDVALGLDPLARVTHVRKTAEGYELQYLEPHHLDIAVPFGVYSQADVQALKAQNRLFGAWQVERYMGDLWQKAELTPKKFTALTGQTFDLPKDSIIVGKRLGPTGYEVQYMPKADWLTLPAHVREGREPTFWEVPLYTHLEKGWTGLLGEVEKKRKEIYGEKYVAFQKVATGPMRESERQLSFFPIGVVKDVESFVGFVEAVSGQPTHRSYISTASGALVSTWLAREPPSPQEQFMSELFFGPQRRAMLGKGPRGAFTTEYLEAEWESVKEAPAGLIAGELGFDLLLSFITGKVAGKATRWASKTRVGKAIQSQLVKHSKRYRWDIARGEVGQAVPKPKGPGLAELRAADIYWEMIQAPRTGGVMIGKSPLVTKGLQTYTFEWVMRGGQLVPQFRPQRFGEVSAQRTRYWQKFWQPERGLTPFVTQTQLTRMGVHPYRAPYVGGRTTTAISRQVIGPVLTAIGVDLAKKLRFEPEFQLQEWQPTLAFQREKLRTTTLQAQEQRQKQVLGVPKMQLAQLQHQPPRQIYRPKPIGRESVFPMAFQLPRSMLSTQQVQKQIALLKSMQLQKHVPPPLKFTPPPPLPIPFFRIPRGGADVSRGVRGLFGRFFKREHPIKSAREMWETFHSGPKKPKKRKKAKSTRKRKKKRRKK